MGRGENSCRKPPWCFDHRPSAPHGTRGELLQEATLVFRSTFSRALGAVPTGRRVNTGGDGVGRDHWAVWCRRVQFAGRFLGLCMALGGGMGVDMHRGIHWMSGSDTYASMEMDSW
eukprot:CAMPEP_0117661880 /NCGR_PEP_ID=MMETSP0804-20121206/7768_1 /TAXON_ID=1074897 /ORGANISM="Tetraselmis astigmatica, Strain CCMP880" /LENGTH=115 /DNA_ID=CAMNT_0005468767 /DNA_START=1400 /DNA_END=1748 /DNA_ORIENTATION=-